MSFVNTRKQRKSKSYKTSDGWRSRGYLPHYQDAARPIFVTWRLHDSLPHERLREIEAQTNDNDFKVSKFIERMMDVGYGECLLANPKIAHIVRDAILHFENARYQLHSWVVMPNHVHLLLTLMDGWQLGSVVKSIKAFSAYKANAALLRKGAVWAREYFDRRVLNEKSFSAVLHYIENNPVKAGLCKRAEDWEFSSASRSAGL